MIESAKLGLGTVQWGLKYGVTNKYEKTPDIEVAKILEYANENKICYLDTAPAYGGAEKTLGKNNLDSFRVITKLDKLKQGVEKSEIKRIIEESFEESLRGLARESVYGLLVHNVDDLKTEKGKFVINALNNLKEKKRVQKIGVSIYNEQDLECAIALFRPDIIQLPFSVIDQSFHKSGSLKKIKDMQIEIHARSVFLQGLMLQSLYEYPQYFRPYVKVFEKWHKKVKDRNISLMEAALSFVKNNDYIDVVIIGVNSLEHLVECCEAFAKKCEFDGSDLSCDDQNLINPSRWKI